MLELRREEIREDLSQMRMIQRNLPDPGELRRRPGQAARAEEQIADFLDHWMNVVNHLVSRFDQSLPTAHRDRVRFLGELDVVPEPFVEKHLVPMIAHYENWAGLRSSVGEQTVVSFLQDHGKALGQLLDHLQQFLEDPEKYGFSLSES